MPPVNLDDYAQWCFVQDWLTAWAKRHLADGDRDWDLLDGTIECIQETQPPRPEPSESPDPDWMNP